MFCPNCGKELPDGVKFCAHCGKAVSLEPQQTQKQIAAPDISSGNTSQDSYGIGESVPQQRSALLLKKKSKSLKIIIGLVSLLLIILVGSFVWLRTNFPGAELNDFLASSVTSTLPLGDSFGRDDFSLTPIQVSYVQNEVGYDDYDEPYVTIMLDITCLTGKWRPQSDDITFWLNGDRALSHKYIDTEIKRGETARYTFTHPLFTSSTKDVSMQLTIKCLTGATVNLYFPVEGVSGFFNGDNYQYPTNEETSTTQPSNTNNFPPPFTPIEGEGYSDHLGEYIDEYGRVLVVSVGTGEGVSYFINIYANQSDAKNYAAPLLEASHGTLDYRNGYMVIAFEDSSGNGLYFERDNWIEDNYTLYVHGDPYVGGCNVESYLGTTFYMIAQGIDPM